MAKKKDAQYFYDEGVWRYDKGLKSAVNYFEKARELAEKDENTTHELLKILMLDCFVATEKF